MLMNSKTGITFSIVAIAAVIVLFASGPLAATKAMAFPGHGFGGFHRGFGFGGFHRGFGFHHFGFGFNRGFGGFGGFGGCGCC
jgi:hypothetical protein